MLCPLHTTVGVADGNFPSLHCYKGRIHRGSAPHYNLACSPHHHLDAVSQSVDLGQRNTPNTTPTKDYKNVRVVVYLRGVQRGCAEEGERGSTPTG